MNDVMALGLIFGAAVAGIVTLAALITPGDGAGYSSAPDNDGFGSIKWDIGPHTGPHLNLGTGKVEFFGVGPSMKLF